MSYQEFNVFWTEFLSKLERLGEITMAMYLKENILTLGQDGLLHAEWQCSFFDVMAGYCVYCSNTLEREWRTIKGMMPGGRFQDLRTCIRRLGEIMYSRLRDGKFSGLRHVICEPDLHLISGPGLFATEEEIIHA